MNSHEDLRNRGLDEASLEVGRIYRLQSRHLPFGAWTGSAFIGIREKFKTYFLASEFPRTLDERFMPFETVDRAEPTAEVVPPNIQLREHLGSYCERCGREAWWTGPPAPARWLCEGQCGVVIPCARPNMTLFEYLKEAEIRQLVQGRPWSPA